ncbi:MAG: glycosyltransferase family 4 protein [Akkermansiaceae bacterium]
MKVGLTATMIQGGRSGVAQYVFSLVRELNRAGNVDLNVFVLEDELPLLDFAKDGCRLVPVPRTAAPPVKNILWHQLTLPKLAADLKLDVLHVPSYRRLVRSAPCPTVGTIHDLAPFHVKGKYDLARMFYGRVVVKLLARAQKEIIAVSHCTARDIENFFGIPQNRMHVIHNGIDHDRFVPGDMDVARAWTAEKHGLTAPYFLYVSRLEHPGKNHVRLIESFVEFKKATGSDWQLALGGGDWHGYEAIKSAAAASPFASDIRFLGFVPDADLPNLYRAARCMVYPSLFEGFGLPPVEAMACGTPVISSTRGALEEVVADAALVVDPENVPDITRALTSLTTDTALADSLKSKGLANAARFQWSRTAAEVTEVYRKAANR